MTSFKDSAKQPLPCWRRLERFFSWLGAEKTPWPRKLPVMLARAVLPFLAYTLAVMAILGALLYPVVWRRLFEWCLGMLKHFLAFILVAALLAATTPSSSYANVPPLSPPPMSEVPLSAVDGGSLVSAQGDIKLTLTAPTNSVYNLSMFTTNRISEDVLVLDPKKITILATNDDGSIQFMMGDVLYVAWDGNPGLCVVDEFGNEYSNPNFNLCGVVSVFWF